ncbi:MAG: hypothetical protein IT359_04465 [Gemmatimonadaceae bacterium]|nr:hypothetical protein [Gemmatimonadaceae bacterium]
MRTTGSTSHHGALGKLDHATARHHRRPTLLTLAVTAAAVLATACGDDGGNATQPTGSFTLSIAPVAVSVVQGATQTITATITRVAPFARPVALSFENAQAGITGTFSSDTVAGTATTSTLTIAAAASVAPGDYPVTVRAKATGMSDQTTTATVTVTAAPSFTLAASPDAISIEQGSVSVTLARVTRTGGFTGAIALAVTGLPDSIVAAVATPSLAGDSSSVTFTVGTRVAPGPYAAILTASATGLTPRSDTVAITVTKRPGFALALVPDSAHLAQGQSGSAVVRLTRDSTFTAPVALTVDSLPAGITATLGQTTLTGDTTALALAIGATATPGNYPVVVRGNSSGRPEAVDTLRLTVTAAPPAIALSIARDSLTATQGVDTTFVVHLTRTNFTDSVHFAIAGLPAGITASAPSTVGDSATVSLTVTAGATVGTATVTVTASGTGITSRQDTLTLIVVAPPSPRIRSGRGFAMAAPAPRPLGTSGGMLAARRGIAAEFIAGRHRRVDG